MTKKQKEKKKKTGVELNLRSTGKSTTAKSRKGLEESQVKYELSKLAQRANARLLSLEKAGLTRYRSYQFAERFSPSKTGKVRFRENVKKISEQQALAELANVKRFLEMPTSEVSKAKATETRRIAASKTAIQRIQNASQKAELKKRLRKVELAEGQRVKVGKRNARAKLNFKALSDEQFGRLIDYFNIDSEIKRHLNDSLYGSESVVETIMAQDESTQRDLISFLNSGIIKTDEKGMNAKLYVADKRQADKINQVFGIKIAFYEVKEVEEEKSGMNVAATYKTKKKRVR